MTASDTKERAAADYVIGFLVNDPFEQLKRIAQSTRLSSNVAGELEIAKSYLKYGFDAHVDSSARCRLHDVLFALGLRDKHRTARDLLRLQESLQLFR